MMTLALFVVDKNSPMGLGDGAIYALLSIVIVFLVLLIIIGITSLIFKLTGLFELKAQLDASKKENVVSNNVVPEVRKPVEIVDDDMMAAVLVATIDYRNEVKKDVRVVSVKQIG